MNEQQFERMMDRLEQKHDGEMLRIGIAAVERNQQGRGEWDVEHAHDEAKDAIEKYLFEQPDWEPVEATVISDVAYEVADRAISQVSTWEGA